MRNKTKFISQILFYGSIWGILEATIGHILHFIPATIAGSIMFPIAAYILYKAYQKLESKHALFYVGLVAASIKSINFLMPQLSIYKTINPMISIVLESLVVIVLIHLITSKQTSNNVSGLIIASISWRTIFVLWMTLQFVLTSNLAPFLKTFESILMFVVFSGVLSGLFAFIVIKVDSLLNLRTSNYLQTKPAISMALFILAIYLTYNL